MLTGKSLIIANGDSSEDLISETGIGDEILAWRDVLRDGPVSESLNIEELSARQLKINLFFF